MRVLFDTNVLVGMLIRREAVIRFKTLIQQKKVVHITSPYILAELERVLVHLGQTTQKAKVSVHLLARQSEIVSPTNIRQICRDPADDAILAATETGRADYLVTEDKDLLVLQNHHSTSIITMAAFIKLIS